MLAKRVKDAMAPESSLPGRPFVELLKRDGMTRRSKYKGTPRIPRAIGKSGVHIFHLQECALAAESPGLPT